MKKVDKRFKPAIEELIEAYTAGIMLPCPLCLIDGIITNNSDCSSCPWVIIEGASCYKMKFSEVKIIDRIPRLERWLKDNIEEATS